MLEIDGRRSFHYSSTYFDTPELDSYRDAARKRPRRYKVRTRRYLDTGTSAVEVKVRSLSGTTAKTRLWLYDETSMRPGSLPLAAVAFVGGFDIVGDRVHDLTEVLTTSYERVTLVTADARVTTDRDVAAIDAYGDTWTTATCWSSRPSHPAARVRSTARCGRAAPAPAGSASTARRSRRCAPNFPRTGGRALCAATSPRPQRTPRPPRRA